MKHILFSSFILLGLVSCKNNQDANNSQGASGSSGIQSKKIIDLSHEYSEETVYWVTAEEFKLDTVFKGETDKGFYYSAFNFSTAEHGGTHIDAPVHFAEGRQSVDEIPLEKLIGTAIKVDVSVNSKNDPDYLISIQDFLDWEKRNGEIPENSILLLQTGFSEYYPNKVKYLGTDLRGEAAVELLHFPGLSPEAAQWLVDNRTIKSIGIDTPSIDYGQSELFESHVILLGENIPAFENLTNLNQLPETGFEIYALPMKIKGGSGAPLRIIAIL